MHIDVIVISLRPLSSSIIALYQRQDKTVLDRKERKERLGDDSSS